MLIRFVAKHVPCAAQLASPTQYLGGVAPLSAKTAGFSLENGSHAPLANCNHSGYGKLASNRIDKV